MYFQKNILIGTSGWSYEHWDKVFYEQITASKRLSFYAEKFSTVELNTTFYHIPTEKAVKNWERITPKNFIFSIKASRYITHVKKLTDFEESTERFFKSVSFLKRKLGPILFQLPPHFEKNLEKLEKFFAFLPQHDCVFEFRHSSWLSDDTFELMKKYNIGFCINDWNGFLTPLEVTSHFVYVRLHGPKKAYRGTYSQAQLKKWSQKIFDWSSNKKKVYCYFNNDEKGFAPQDALRLQNLLRNL